jgi:tol-pal system protein YbgF
MESMMKLCARLVLVLLTVPFLCPGQSRELVATQQVIRDLATFEDRTRAAQKATDEKLEKLLQQTQAAIEAATKANASVAGLEPILKEQVAEQQKIQANSGLKVTQMAEDLQSLKESVNQQNVRLGKIEQLITDLKTALTTLQSPPTPPGEASAPPGGLSPDTLFQNALRDKNGGNTDLALKEFTDYTQNFGKTFLAPQAQFYIGEIYYNSSELEKAADAFDVVLEKYQENDKTPDAHYMKGMALLKLAKKAEARREFEELIKNFPGNPLASQAKKQIAALAPAAKPPASKSKSK